MKCNIVQELLPAYVENATGRETKEEIKEHLKECEECRRIYEKMAAEHSANTKSANNDKWLIDKLKSRLRRNHIITAVITCLVLVLVLFALFYEIALPFDANRMFVERVSAALMYDEKLEIYVPIPLDEMNDQEAKEFQTGNYEVYDLAWISYRGINNVGYTFRDRIIDRNGEKVRVTYICFFKTIWDALFFSDFADVSESGGFCSVSHDNVSSQEEYTPVQTEIYYLPGREMITLSHIDDLSDGDFDALKEKASLIWDGIT